LQYIGPPFSTVYEQWCKSKGIPPNIVTLKSGVKAFWAGDPQAKHVVIYYHGNPLTLPSVSSLTLTGGGFSMDGGPEHLDWWAGQVQPELKEADKSVAFLFLEYTLVPHGTYPVQVKEAVEALDYVLNDLKRSPADVVLAGDSAGGNMCLATLSHIMHPAPDIPKLDIHGKLKGLILVAPWVSFRLDFESAKANVYKDIITETVGNKWSSDYMAGKAITPYANALTAEAAWWKDSKVEHILCVAGADELLCDPITEWVEKYKVSDVPPSIFVCISPDCVVCEWQR
jgi:alpha/beta hydrolase fold